MDNEILAAFLETQKQQTEILSALQKGLGPLRTKTPAGFGTYTELHGDGSLWGNKPLERDIITAHVRPHGLASVLPVYPTVVERPWFGTLTGYTDTTGSEATNPCDDNPAGFVKGAYLTAQFGRLARDSQTIDIDKVMLRANRGDFTDLRLRGQVLGEDTLFRPNMSQEDILNVVTKSEMVIMGVNIERKLSQHLWQGVVSANTSGGGYKEFPGLDVQITTGHVDAETGTAVPSLDSDLRDFNFNDVDGAARDIVNDLSSMEFNLRYNAERMGLDPVTWVLVMTPELWYELSAVWPCRYLTNRCSVSAGTNPMVINDNVNVQLRDQMRNQMFIDINGNRYQVITDTGIFTDTNTTNANLAAGQFSSDIYFVPLRITGNFPVTYFEHLDYRMAQSDVNLLNGTQQFWWTDGGLYMWAIEQTKFCYKLTAKTEQRIILRTPHLAGRLQNVRYTPAKNLRSPYADDPYHVNGGVSIRGGDTFSAVWS